MKTPFVIFGSLLIASAVSLADDKPTIDQAVAGWPQGPRDAARELAKKYGAPDEVTPSMLVWNDTGPWKRTVVHRKEVQHDWPEPHTDFVEQFIDYKVPVDKFDDLAAFDGSVIAERTKGELSARCAKEAMNFLAINLAHDVARGATKVEDARKRYEQAAAAFMANKPQPITQKLMFQPVVGQTGDPDRPAKPSKAASR
ncbi:MAG: hypothetical protein H0V17_27080 [Deltaproteobacteria bacterium]|nr:hypothetical protein [Deltaproteobacteria bacterium]